jgi:hypothetical protein
VLVFDATALVSLFHGYQPLSALWFRADEGAVTLGFPVLAILEAGIALGAPAWSWDAV